MMKYQKIIRNKLVISRALLAVSIMALVLLAYYRYAPYVYAYRWQEISQAWAMVVRTGGPLLFILVFSLIWPRPGGIIAVLYGTWQVWLSCGSVSLYTVPSPVIVLLYLLFTAGGAFSIAGAGPKRKLIPEKRFLYNMLMAARILAFGTVGLTALVYLFISPVGFLFSVPALVIALIARSWPTAGGVLMIFLAGWGVSWICANNWVLAIKLPGFIFSTMFIHSGVLHIWVAWRGRESCNQNPEIASVS